MDHFKNQYAREAYSQAGQNYKETLIDIDQALYKYGRRFRYEQHQNKYNKWLAKKRIEKESKALEKYETAKEKQEMEQGYCFINTDREELKANVPLFRVSSYIDYLKEAKKEIYIQNKHDIELAEYYLDHFQYFQSLTIREQFDILTDRFEWFLHEPTMLLLDRILY